MGTIDVVGKWSLEDNCWCLPKHDQKGRSFAFAKYEQIINDYTSGINYIILACATRVEDHSKDFIHIKDTVAGVNKIISYFKKLNKNVTIELFFMDADAPIVEDAKLLAHYIDSLSCLTNTNSVNLVGISKGAAMAFNIPKYFQKMSSFDKTNIYTIATPFTGTKIASPGIFYPEVKKLITSKLGDNKLSDMVYKRLISVYEGISSNSHMDYDIAVSGGINGEKLKLYDESLIRDMFSSKNISAISKVSNYRNLVTGIDDKTFGEAFRTMNFTGIALCILNSCFFEGKSDGMVMTEAQRNVESKLEICDFKSDILPSSHHAIASNDRVFNDVLYIIDDTIEAHNDRVKCRIRNKR